MLHVETPPREVLEALANERNPLYEEIADVTIRTDDQSAKVVANQIIHIWKATNSGFILTRLRVQSFRWMSRYGEDCGYLGT